MLSYSSNTQYPAFSHKPNDRWLTQDVHQDSRLDPEQVRLWSYQEPAMTPGSYGIKVEQTLHVSGSDVPQQLDLPAKLLRVPGPKLTLLNPKDIRSVYPAPGQSDYSETLAHVVFNHPTIPWELRMDPEKVGFNQMPWLAVLSFTEDELVLDPNSYKDAGFKVPKPSRQGSVMTTPNETIRLHSVVSSLDPGDIGQDYAANDPFQLLLLRPEVFRPLFSSIGQDGKPHWTGSPYLGHYAMMAHVRETHGGFMASTDANNVQPQCAVVVSPRSGPPGLTEPTRIISHLVSLDRVGNMDIAKDGTNFAALVSLYSWDWMCIPHNQVDFATVMRGLGRSVQPLRVPDENINSLQNEKETEADRWLHHTLRSGYSIKMHTLKTGKGTRALFRGPLIPVLPSPSIVEPFSMNGENLEIIDKETGLVDISYSAAWNLARATAMADKSFTASLLRLRGNVHAEAVKEAKKRKLGINGMDIAAYLQDLETSVGQLASAQNVDSLADRGTSVRWHRTEEDRHGLPVLRLTEGSQYNSETYMDEIADVMASFFGLETDGGNPAKPIDPDAMLVRAWVLDRFYLAGVPLHYLVTDPDMVPRESIRTFSIDSVWIDAFVDGALSLANHFAKEDDALRREIKNCIKTYLSTPLRDGPGKDYTLQIPKWGFLIRSVAVTAFPDLKIEVRMGEELPRQISEVLYMQILSDDILICLIDRVPGQDNLDRIIISQPHHQQSYAVGSLTESRLDAIIRPIPLTSSPDIVSEAFPLVRFEKDDETTPPVYDFETRMLRPQVLASRYLSEIEEYISKHERMSDQVFKWTGTGVPSSILAAQLSKPILQLILKVDAPETNSNSSNDERRDSYKHPAAQLYVKPRPPPQTSNPVKKSINARPAPSFAKLPTGPRSSVSVASLSRKLGIVKLHEKKVLELVQWEEAITPTWPSVVDCHPIYDTAYDSSVLYAVDEPIDLIFNVKDHRPSNDSLRTFPQSIEVRIPVTFSLSVNPPVTINGNQALLVIPGTPASPTLPRVEGLDRGSRWLHTTKLVLGTLSSGRYIPSLSPVAILVVKLTSRLSDYKLYKIGRQIDASFILRNVNIVKPDEGAALGGYQTSFDVACLPPPRAWHPQSKATVRSTQLTIRQATTLVIIEPTYYDLDQPEGLHVSLESFNLITDAQQLVMVSLSKSNSTVVNTVLDSGPLATSTQGKFVIPMDKHTLPKWVKFVVRLKDNDLKNVGPSTELWKLPDVPLTPVLPRLYWQDKLRISWDVPTAQEPPIHISFTLKNSVGGLVESSKIDVVNSVGYVDISQEKLTSVVSAGWCVIQFETRIDIKKVIGGIICEDLTFVLQEHAGPELTVECNSARIARHSGLIGQLLIENQLQFWYTSVDNEVGLLHMVGPDQLQAYPQSVCSNDMSGHGSALGHHFDNTRNMQSLFWIPPDGNSICIALRSWKDSPSWFYYTSPNTSLGRACVNGGGSIEVKSINQPFVLVWYVGSEGAIYMVTFFRAPGQVVLLGVAERARITPGGVAIGASRVSELKAHVEHDKVTLFFIDWSGNVVCFHDATKPIVSESEVHGIAEANASLESGLELYKHQDPDPNYWDRYVLFVFWITRDGGVCGAWGSGDNDNRAPWTKFDIAPPGSAHTSSRIRAISDPLRRYGFNVLWFNPMGRLQVAIPAWVRRGGSAENMIWSCSEFRPVVETPTDGMLNVTVVEWPSTGFQQLVWVRSGDGCLATMRIAVQSPRFHPPLGWDRL